MVFKLPTWSKKASLKRQKVDYFMLRTQGHISLVKKYGERIKVLRLKEIDYTIFNKEMDNHDRSKFDDEEYAPYIELSWKHKVKRENPDMVYELKDVDSDAITKAIVHHYLNNPHHPEYWYPDYSITVYKSKRRIDVSQMPLTHVACMVADMCAMSEELGGSPKSFFDSGVNTKWVMSDTQINFAHSLFDKIYY